MAWQGPLNWTWADMARIAEAQAQAMAEEANGETCQPPTLSSDTGVLHEWEPISRRWVPVPQNQGPGADNRIIRAEVNQVEGET
jgi:hypothetical protein